MIVFLNFAPFEFYGGAEKWMLDTASYINKKEPVTLVSVSSSISNFYSKLVLKRKFETRVSIDKKKYSKIISLSLKSFIPFTSEWFKIHKIFLNSSSIYLKFELQELIIAIYFGGFGILKKAIGGIHSPFFYPSPTSFFDKLHNFLYTSFLSRFILKRMSQIHVITSRDEKLMKDKYKLSNVTFIPNYAEIPKRQIIPNYETNKKSLNIIFVGELNMRKGVDMLLNVIQKSPDHFKFNIIGNGPMKDDVLKIQVEKNNLIYHGYLAKQEVSALIKKSDVFFLPSRAEGFSLAILEAMSYGLTIVDSTYVKLDLPDYVEFSTDSTPSKYLESLEKIYAQKKQNKLPQIRIRTSEYFNTNYSPKIVLPQLSNLFV